MKFTGRLCGSVPLSKDLVPIWLKSRMPAKKPEDGKPIKEIEKEVQDSIEETEERVSLGFQQENGNLVVRGGTLKAHIKDCSLQVMDIVGVKAFRSKVANQVQVTEYFIPINKTRAKLCGEPDGSYEQPVHVVTRQGPLNALKVINYIDKPLLKFEIKVLNKKKSEITEEVLRTILDYGSVHGYGGERGMQEGRYTYKLTEVK
jgi:hypothetical protein